MDGKLTLITPPDFFENNNDSILFIHLSPEEQDRASHWLADSKIADDINIYIYNDEIDIPWLFHAMAHCKYKYIDLNGLTTITQALGGYILGKSNVFFKTDDVNLAEIYKHINLNRINQVENFLESVLGGETN
jgi:hypothetical protein